MTTTSEKSALPSYGDALSRYEPVLGLETHVELGTVSKMFCGCPTAFGAEPNTQVCPTCLGLPGSLPVTNEAAVEATIRIGLALHCRIAPYSRFARKNYFYPDMPKDFQISQYDEPLCVDGFIDVDVDGEPVRVEIERVHLEEDTGKSLHVGGATGRIHGATHSLVDYNRAGIPLVEIVTKPVPGTGARAAAAARAYVTELRETVRALAVSDVRMEQGSLRCDVNVSLMPAGSTSYGTRTETKNVNSLRSVERAVRHEVARQAAVLDAADRVVLETRHFHEDSATTSAGRSKEEAQDYRYFPEPDLVPLAPSADWVESLRASLTELPAARRERLAAEHGFSALDVSQLEGARVLELVVETIAAGAPAVEARSWWLNELRTAATERDFEPVELSITPVEVARVAALVASGELTTALARQVVEGVLAGEGGPDEVVAARGLRVADESAVVAAVNDAIAANPGVVEKVRAGKTQAANALIGPVMKATSGHADAARVRELVAERLGVAL
jgi:aspartyl-tRNA(Asn)/glutamyl-tRNA(Gln) amidotransferase subunit B